MNAGDVLMKKWCFGMGRSKAREEGAMNSSGELVTYRTYPKYRTIVFKVDSASKNGETWRVFLPHWTEATILEDAKS